MKLNSLTAVSPIDGRYHDRTKELSPYFSEYALIKYRVQVEIEYFIALAALGLPVFEGFPLEKADELREIYKQFTVEDAMAVKTTERKTNHDVKAVEYFIKDKLEDLGLEKYQEFIHFGLTSQDVNNTSYPLMVKNAVEQKIIPSIERILDSIQEKVEVWKDISMLARTHGQPATPTKLGKEFKVFHERLSLQLERIKTLPFAAKFGGATGNLNAHLVAYPHIDWVRFANRFVKENLGLTRSQTTTQIEHYDFLAALFDGLKRINTILIDFSRDMWAYISTEYFLQKVKKDEVGSSTMPHKVNPIDFENAEGNLGIATALFEHLAHKLPISRLQRDLSDSTVLRNIGVPMAHQLIAFMSIEKGIDKLLLNEEKLKADLENNWAIIGEAIQTILRREGFPKPYEALKELTRNNTKITQERVHEFIDSLAISEEVKRELKEITPHNYTGV